MNKSQNKRLIMLQQQKDRYKILTVIKKALKTIRKCFNLFKIHINFKTSTK